MEAFSHHFHNDSVFQTNINNHNNHPTFFTQQTYPSDQQHQINYTQHIDSKSSSLDYSSSKTACYYSDDNENVMNSMDDNKKNRDGSSLISAKFKDGREGKCRKQKKCNEGKSKLEGKKAKNEKKEKSKNVDQESPTLGYIHVRARRGQATDSHSLAERVRREKISERMKLLQALVPGCDKVTGKALMLEEIINYVQSLQNQVEFLSMKLASFNPMIYDFGVDPNTLMMRSERLSGLASTTSLPFVQQCSPTTAHPMVFTDSITTTTTAATTFNLPHSSHYSGLNPSALVRDGQGLTPFTEDNESQLWELDGQKQNLMNLSSLFNNNMCSFN